MRVEASEPPVAELREVTKRFSGGGGVTALDGVTFEIGRNHITAITGPSGSGKTTALNLLGLLDVPTTGDIYLSGRRVTSASEVERRMLRASHIGFVFQSYHLVPYLDALDNVRLGLRYTTLDQDLDARDVALQALEAVHIDDRAAHYPGELSGGEQQRVAIARAIVKRPDLLLADEPTGNLDRAATSELLGAFEEIRHRGQTVVIVTHDDLVSAVADQVIDFSKT